MNQALVLALLKKKSVDTETASSHIPISTHWRCTFHRQRPSQVTYSFYHWSSLCTYCSFGRWTRDITTLVCRWHTTLRQLPISRL